MKQRATLGAVGRAVAVTLGAVMAATLVAAPAQAAETTWWMHGPYRMVKDYPNSSYSFALWAARGDIEQMRNNRNRNKGCPGNGAQAIDENVTLVENQTDWPRLNTYQGHVLCRSNRASG